MPSTPVLHMRPRPDHALPIPLNPERPAGAATSRSPSGPRLRRLGPDDKPALAKHLTGLSEVDRCTRFGGQTSDAAIYRHCDTLDLANTICWATLDGSGAVVGAAFGFACGAGPLVEVAVSVDPEHRRRGLGACLAARVCAEAAERGARGAAFEFHPRNAAIRGLIRRLGSQVGPCAEECLVALPMPLGLLSLDRPLGAAA